MSKFRTYEDLDITVIRRTGNPGSVVYRAANLTQTNIEGQIVDPPKEDIAKLIKFLVKANHTSILEHAHITFQISNISRSFLAQITRHRMASYTSSSQHYQMYDNYPNVFHKSIDIKEVRDLHEHMDDMYRSLLNRGIPKEEARQVLPNSKAVNLLWTINARSLMNFLNLRLCKRNVAETLHFAEIIKDLVIDWFPELFDLIGPDCEMTGECTQGFMKAKECRGE